MTKIIAIVAIFVSVPLKAQFSIDGVLVENLLLDSPPLAEGSSIEVEGFEIEYSSLARAIEGEYGEWISDIEISSHTQMWPLDIGRRGGVVSFGATILDWNGESFRKEIRCALVVDFTFFFSNPMMLLFECAGENLPAENLGDYLENPLGPFSFAYHLGINVR